MSRVLFGWPAYSDIGPLYSPSINGGSWSGTLPLTNLQDRRLAKVARSSSAALADTRCRIDLKTDRFVALITVPRHSMSLAGKYRFLGVPSTLLFDYEAGDDIAAQGGTFTRSGTATYVDSTGVLRTAATDVPRDSHFINGVRTILLEGARTNICLRSEELENATWTKTRSSISANADTAPDGTASADRVVEDNSVTTTHQIQQASLTITADANVAYSLFAKAGTRNWLAIRLQDSTSADVFQKYFNIATGALGSTFVQGTGAFISASAEAIGNGWYRIKVVGNIGNGRTNVTAVMFMATADNVAVYTGDGVSYLSLWGAQIENNASFPSSYITTTTASATRNADSLRFPYTAVPQALSVYCKAISNQPSNFDGSFVWAIGTAAGTRLTLHKTNAAATVTGTHRSAAGTVTSVPAAVVTYGQLVEYRTVLGSDGKITQADSVAGAAETVGAASAANALDGAWAATTIWLNSDATPANVGFNAFQSLRIALAAPTLAAMQASVYDSGWLEAYPPVYPAGSLTVGDPRLVTGDVTAEEFLQGVPMPALGIPTTPFLGRYWSMQVDDALNAAGYVDLARLVVAGGYQPTINPNYGMKVGWEDSSVRQESDGGAAIFNVKRKRRVAMGVIEHVPDDEAWANPFEMMRVMGISEQIFFVLDLAPNSAYHLARRAFLCTLRELTALELVVGPRDGWPFAVTEEL